MTNNTIPNVPRELLEVIEQTWRIHYQGGPATTDIAADAIEKGLGQLRALLSAPPPAGMNGLEVVQAVAWLNTATKVATTHPVVVMDWDDEKEPVESLMPISQHEAVIDGLRGEVTGLRKRAKTAEREAGSALRTYKGLEKVARVVSDNSDQVCGELNVLRQQFDQQARRIGELEGLLREVRPSWKGEVLASWCADRDAAIN